MDIPPIQPDASLLLSWQLKSKHVLIVGGGNVASGRLDAVLEASASVTLVSPRQGLDRVTAYRIFEDVPDVKSRISYIDREFTLDRDVPLIESADMVLTAIDDVNLSKQICALSRARKIPVNVADIPPECDFYFGSQIRDGPLQIMISTGGAAPKLSNLIRKRVEEALPPPPFLGNAIRRVGILRARLRRRAPGVGGPLGKKRMRWVVKVCESWSFEQLAQLDDEKIERLLNEGWDKDLSVPSYEDLGGTLSPVSWGERLPPGTLPVAAGFVAGILFTGALALLRRSSLLDPVAQHAADIVQTRGLGIPDRNALMAGVLSQRSSKSSLFSKDSKTKERDLRVFLFDCAIVLLTPNPNEKEKGWVLFCDPIPIELLTIRAIRTPPSTPHSPQARRSWFLDRLPTTPIHVPARSKTPPPFSSGRTQPSSPSSAGANGNGNGNGIEASDFSLVLSALGRKDPSRTWPITLHAADAVEQRAWAQSVSARQEEIRVQGRDGTMRGWGLTPIKIGSLGGARVTCHVDYDVDYIKARLWGTPDGIYEHILNAPNQQLAVRKILDLPNVTHVLVVDFDERLMIVLVAEQTAYLAPFPGPSATLEVSRLKKLATNITHIAAGVLVSQPTPPPNAGTSPPSAFIDPEAKRERRKSNTLTKPPPRGAVVSGASSTKSEVPSMARKEQDKDSVRTGPAPSTPPTPSIISPAPVSTAAPATPPAPSTPPRSALAPPATPHESFSPTKGKEKEKKSRRLSDIAIFSLWKRKAPKEKQAARRISTAASDIGPSTAHSASRAAQTTTDEPKANQATTAKTESAVSSLKPAPPGYDGPALTKTKSATLPPALMRLPSFEFDRPKEEEAPKTNGNGEAHEPKKPASVDNTGADETGALTGLGRPSTTSQTMPSRASTAGSGFGRITRKLTTDSARSVASKPKEPGPPPQIQIPLDFPTIAWPSMLDAGSANKSDLFAGSDFLADVQKDIGDLMAGGLGTTLSEETGGDTSLGRSRSPVREVITEEPEGTATPATNEPKENETPGPNANTNGKVEEPAEDETPAPVVEEQGASNVAPVLPVSPAPPSVPMASPRPSQPPQHTRFLVLSKSTTLSTSVRLYTIGGLKVEDDGDIGGGRLTFYKECYVPSQTYSIDFLKSRICFASNDGFEILDPTNGKVDQFLDPVELSDADGPLGFLINHPRRPKPGAVFRVDQKFLCCYDDFAFFLDKFGKRTREDWLIKWLGTPTSFSVQYPYLFAFEPEFTEIRHCATGELLQLIPQPNSKRLLAGDFIAPAQKMDGTPHRRVSGEILLESEGSLYALRPLQQ
ncbi:Bifunctional dehydrogenase and ferrochelatase [Ceratobasidium sp. 423]|nr:Bifunctional dehydrogenase and ferrochelatase [Ceratobasidium sp. 423]